MLKIVKNCLDDDNKDIQAINEISIKCDVNNEDVSKVLTTLYIHLMQKYVNKEPIYIPFIGNLFLKYTDEIMTDEGRKAIVNVDFELSDLMRNDIARFETYEDVFFDKIQFQNIKELLKNSGKK